MNGKVVAPTAADVLDVRSFFGMSDRDARTTIREVAAAVGEWRRVATAIGIDRAEQQQVAVALTALETAAKI